LRPPLNRLFDLQLGPVAMAFCGVGTEAGHKDLDHVVGEQGPLNFAANWLEFKGLDWAADLIRLEFEEELPWLDVAE